LDVVRLNCKTLRLAVLIPVLVLAGAGCSGVSTSQSVSPATFLLPGLLQADPPAGYPELMLPGNEPSEEVARL
jgi:hypothetical protein